MRLALDGITVTVDAARLVETLTLDCPAGSVVGLVGPNGSGKSTALRTIYRAVTPTAGTLRLGERDLLGDLSARQAARHVAVLAQEPPLSVDFTVAEVVATGRTPHQDGWRPASGADRRTVAGALELVGLAQHGDRALATLSGGERQRALLARALVQEPDVLVLDEPTNHLDVQTQLALLELIRSLGITVLAALHDLNLAAAYCDLLHVLRDGTVVASGPPEHVLTADLVADVFGVAAHRGVHPATGRLHLAFSPLV